MARNNSNEFKTIPRLLIDLLQMYDRIHGVRQTNVARWVGAKGKYAYVSLDIYKRNGESIRADLRFNYYANRQDKWVSV